MTLRRRLSRLERLLPPPPPPTPADRLRQQRLGKLLRRWEELLQQALPLMTAPQQEQVNRAVEQLAGGWAGPYADWLRDLCDGKSRLPALPAETMRALLLAWLSPEVDRYAIVCRQCGLEYPHHQSPPLSQWKLLPGRRWGEGPPPWYDLPCFFTVCPGCGASPFDIDWAHLVGPAHRPWMELDGYVGRADAGGRHAR